MAKLYYYNENGEKIGIANGEELKALAAEGTITPDTLMETEAGRKELADQMPGLFPNAPSPVAQTEPPKVSAPVTMSDDSQDTSSTQPMEKWYYRNMYGEKTGATYEQLKELVAEGTIKPNKLLETETGDRKEAIRLMPGLFYDYKARLSYDYKRIALAHRLSTWSILNFVFITPTVIGVGVGTISTMGGNPPMLFFGFLALAAIVSSFYLGAQLAKLLHYSRNCITLFIVSAVLCLSFGQLGQILFLLLGLVPFFTVYLRAGRILKQAGYSVCLFSVVERRK